MEFAMVASYEKYVLDNEIIGMAMRAVRGIQVTPETIGAEVIQTVGPGGNFLTEEHTTRYLRSEFFFPRLSDREPRENWEAEGASNTRQRVRQRAQELLDTHQPLPLPEEIVKRIHAEIPGLVV
jgi:trimethylamine--corrinoid protein Co-methyltransferase